MVINSRFKLENQIGEGGMARIWLARDLTMLEGSPFERVVVKAVKSEYLSQAVECSGKPQDDAMEVIGRLADEARIFAGLPPHPNIVRLIDVGELTSGNPFFVMEHLEGKPLDEVCKDLAIKQRLYQVRFVDGKYKMAFLDPRDVDWVVSGYSFVPKDDLRRIVEQILEGVAHLHVHGIKHRDLKPGNIMLLDASDEMIGVTVLDGDQLQEVELEAGSLASGGVKILDFGLAKVDAELRERFGVNTATRLGMTMGTPAYMPSEQFFDCSNVGPQADVYAIGIMMFEMITGLKPYNRDENPAATLVALATADPFDPAKYVRYLPFGLREIVMKATQREAKNRYSDAGEMLRAFREDIRWEETAHPLSLPPRPPSAKTILGSSPTSVVELSSSVLENPSKWTVPPHVMAEMSFPPPSLPPPPPSKAASSAPPPRRPTPPSRRPPPPPVKSVPLLRGRKRNRSVLMFVAGLTLFVGAAIGIYAVTSLKGVSPSRWLANEPSSVQEPFIRSVPAEASPWRQVPSRAKSVPSAPRFTRTASSATSASETRMMSPAARAVFELGVLYFKHRQYRIALRKFEAAQTLAPDNFAIKAYIAKCRQRLRHGKRRRR
jgi:serine/threonine-protein kinase